ncbi:DUF2177 family protein [Limibaculum sp. M0105]|uniref:DUF2177 family protein n=1 Tax=Thermohalobaculum xanthum TaxID=2753746 RepID=A0A8J7SAY4_9RHOB|nr:DUF2177 family protein [Thermohalobaculum xanthum]MBK0398143.1 DUF2177 family protein [Thermohalobaculum xanthum]
MHYIVLYLTTATVFLAVDAIWLKLVMRPLFEREVGDLLADEVRLGPAAAFYLLYVGGILWFASLPAWRSGEWSTAALNAALLGFLAYGTYEATNFATLRGWTWQMVVVDVGWGMVLTASAALSGLWLTRALTGG